MSYNSRAKLKRGSYFESMHETLSIRLKLVFLEEQITASLMFTAIAYYLINQLQILVVSNFGEKEIL